MSAWTRWRTAALGAALIAVTNAVALLGVAYNRSGEPESVLTLSPREIGKAGDWGFGRENSSIELALRWRMTGADYYGFNYYVPEGDVEDSQPWIDRAGLAALGFDIPEQEDEGRWRRHIERLASREALVVLELDGPAYRRELARARRNTEVAQARAAALPNDAELKRRAEGAKNQLARIEGEDTRLYMVDAGPDLAALRAKYPDNTRYGIVRAEIRPTLHERKGKPRLSAYARPVATRIMVPLAHRHAWERGSGAKAAPAEVKVAFGRRLEPWLVSLAPRSGGSP